VPAKARDKVDADISSSLVRWKCVCQNCSIVGPDESCTYSLDETEEDQHSTVDRQTAQARAYGEDREAEIVEPNFAVHVGQPAESQEQNSGHENVAHQNPEGFEGSSVETPSNCRESDEDNVAVQLGHECPDGGVGQNSVLVLQFAAPEDRSGKFQDLYLYAFSFRRTVQD